MAVSQCVSRKRPRGRHPLHPAAAPAMVHSTLGQQDSRPRPHSIREAPLAKVCGAGRVEGGEVLVMLGAGARVGMRGRGESGPWRDTLL